MLTNPTALDLAGRLALATLAGMVIGYNREARSQAAGLRTTTLVCVSACLSMVLANLLLDSVGPDPKSYIRLDVMRLPLGVLTGIGFIGAGAIIRRGDSVSGVSTAATLWFMTLVGLVFGAGQFALGVIVTAVGLALLSLLEVADRHMRRRFRSALTVSLDPARISEAELRQALEDDGQRILSWAVTYRDGGQGFEVRAEVEWEGRPSERAHPPAFVGRLGNRPGVRELDWTPHQVSA
jgi:putative Mg2+ transporter-C (MgtC) family protein